MPAAASVVDQAYASKLSQLKQRRALSSGRSNSSYSADSLMNGDIPHSASSTASTLRSEMGDHLNLSLTHNNQDQDEASGLQLAAVEEQLRSVADENGRLMKLLAEKDYEIRKLKKRAALSQVDETLCDGIPNSVTGDVAASKIIELSKRIRELTSELHKEQNRNKQFGKQVAEKEDEIRVLQSELASVSTLKMSSALGANKKRSGSKPPTGKQTQPPLTEEEVNQLKDKLDATTGKMLEYRAQLETSKLELKRTQKALQSEVGEQYSLHDILSGKTNSNSGWRGRQQKIIELQQKLQEYKEFAANSAIGSVSNALNSSNMTARTVDTLEDEMMLTNPSGSLNGSGHLGKEDKNKAHIRNMEKKRQEEIDLLKTQVKTLEGENSRLQQNSESGKARIKTLSNETKSLKNQIALLKEKSLHDDELVTALMGQVEVLKEDLNRAIQAEKEASLGGPSNKLTAAQEQVERAIVDQLKQVVSEKEAKIQELQMQLMTASNTPQGFTALNDVSSPQKSLTALSEGVAPLSKQLSLVSMGSNSRPNSNTQRRPDSVGSGGVQSELRIQELTTLLSAACVEKEKLREFCSLLQKRVDEAVEYKLRLEKELSHHKKRSVLLEKQLGAATVSTNSSVNVSSTGLPPANRTRTTGTNSSNMHASSISLRDSSLNGVSVSGMEEVTTRCELLQEEIVSLKFNLQSIMRARDEDFSLYKNMIEETKNVFLTALRQIKQQNAQSDDPTIVSIT